MAIGESANFVAYSLSPAIIVAPLMAVSVVVRYQVFISSVLSVFFLNETLNFTAIAGILLCIIGAVIVVLYGPTSSHTTTLPEFFHYVIAPGISN